MAPIKFRSTEIAGTATVKANIEWGLVVKDLNSIIRGYMTEWTGTGWGDKKHSKPLQVVVQNRAFKIDK